MGLVIISLFRVSCFYCMCFEHLATATVALSYLKAKRQIECYVLLHLCSTCWKWSEILYSCNCNSTEQSPSGEANSFSASQEIPPPPFYGTRRFITALTRAYPYSEPDKSSPFYFLKIPFNIIPSTSWSSKCSLSLRFPHQKRHYCIRG